MTGESVRDDVEKSEEPTAKRRDDARKRGQFPRSRNIAPVVTLISVIFVLNIGGGKLVNGLGAVLRTFFQLAGDLENVGVDDLLRVSIDAAITVTPTLAAMFALLAVTNVFVGFIQSGFVLAAEPLRPQWKRINPLSGFARLCSGESIVESTKAVLVLSCLTLIGWSFLRGRFFILTGLPGLQVDEILRVASYDSSTLAFQIVTAMAVFAICDYLHQRWQTEKKLRMSRQEVREEMREQEGDPLLKFNLKRLRQRLTRRRMMRDVEKADVVITNPTHLAVALRYRATEMSAPRVVGKGAGFIADKIREVARARHIPLIEDKPLARVLFQQVEIGGEVPESLYRAVAGVLAYVYRLRGAHQERITG
jgi:flagellar biosynthetic protein FlhB